MDPKAFQNFNAKLKLGLPENDSKENTEATPQLKLRIKSDHLSYTSTVQSLSGNGIRYDPYYSTYIAIRNKEDNTLKLFEVEQITVGAKIKAPPTKNPILLQNKMEKDEEEDEKKVKAAAKKHLVTEFGQAKGKRIYTQADRMAVEVANMTEKLSKAAENVKEESILLPNQQIEEINLTPPCTRDVTKVSEVYKIQDMLSKEELKSLIASAKTLPLAENQEAINEAHKTKQISDLMAMVLSRQLKEENMEKIALALYMEGIIKFMNFKANELSKGPIRSLPDFLPNSIKHKIFQTFTDETRISPESKDRSLCYILVLALIINEFTLDLSIVISSIKFLKVAQ